MSFAVLDMAAQNSKGIITLTHNGNETYFAYDKIKDAVNAAENGDTISFSKGEFPTDFILNKAVTLIGTGSEEAENWGNGTKLTGNISILIPNSNRNTNLVFDGLRFYNQVTLSSTLGDVTFRRCLWGLYFAYENNSIETLLLDRCDCPFYLGATYPTINKKLIAKNCKIRSLCTIGENNFFYNCTIRFTTKWSCVVGDQETTEYYCPVRGYFYNCILGNGSAFLKYPYETGTNILTNTLYDNYYTNIDVAQNCTLESCYTNDSKETNICELTKANLEDNKYLGTDGTVIGCYGGENPFSLKNTSLLDPTIISSKVHFNKDQEQIEVNINANSK